MNEIDYVLFAACVVGSVLLAVNLKVKLPKKLFAFIAVLILVLMFALVMEDRGNVFEERTISASGDAGREIFSGPFSLGQGNNDFSVRALCARTDLRIAEYTFEFEEEVSSENASNFDCELRCVDGCVLKCSALVFFEKNLKCVFVFPEGFDLQNAITLRLICGNERMPILKRITEREREI